MKGTSFYVNDTIVIVKHIVSASIGEYSYGLGKVQYFVKMILDNGQVASCLFDTKKEAKEFLNKIWENINGE